jgi:hypothetical protein
MKALPNVLADVRKDYLDLLGVSKDACDEARVVIITGDNASGKSFLRRLISYIIKRDHEIESIHLSQEGRATQGFQRAMIYGGEDQDSTGYITLGTFLNGFTTSRSRDTDHILIWDEPEIGLGEEAQPGAAQFIVEQLKDWPNNLRGLVVMTHSRIFVSALKDLDGAKYVHLGGQYKTADEWLNRRIVPVAPDKVREAGLEKWRSFNSLFDKIKKEKVSSND